MSNIPSFDAVMIEHTLAAFFGKQIGDRTTFFDADNFRNGRPKNLAVIVRAVANELEKRVARIQFSHQSPGGPKAQVQGCVSHLRSLANRMQGRPQEPEDYHWEIFGALMMAIVGLLEHLEATGSAPAS